MAHLGNPKVSLNRSPQVKGMPKGFPLVAEPVPPEPTGGAAIGTGARESGRRDRPEKLLRDPRNGVTWRHSLVAFEVTSQIREKMASHRVTALCALDLWHKSPALMIASFPGPWS
jgi:hypothetical protein